MPKSFNGKTSGKLASVMIADKDTSVRVVLWNEKADLITTGGIKQGRIVRFSHCYTREDRKGIVELHVGDKAEIDSEVKNVEETSFPTARELSIKTKDLTMDLMGKRVHVAGLVEKAFEPSVFERKGSEAGKVMRFVLRDGTGEVSVVVWNEKVDEISSALDKDVGLQIVNGRIKKGLTEWIEVHVDSATYIQVLGVGGFTVNIGDLREGMRSVNVEGEVVAKPTVRTVKTAKGETVQVANFELKDKTGQIRVSAWRKLAETMANIDGDEVILTNVYVKHGFDNRIEVVAGESSSVTTVSAESNAWPLSRCRSTRDSSE
jgi:ssDNA-binding replication factor A large subunit